MLFLHYQYEFRSDCQTCAATYEPSIIEVWNGLQVAATYQDTGQAVPPRDLNEFPPIEELFGVARWMLDGDPEVFEITYDPELKYPTKIKVDFDTRAIDDESSYFAGNMEHLPEE